MASYQIQQSTTSWPLVFFMTDSSDHISGKTGLSPTVTISKNGGAFASPSGAVSEIANGWYKVGGNATDTGTLGPLALHATGTGADACDILYEVVAVNPQSTAYGLSLAKTTNITGFNDIAATAIVSNGAITTNSGAVTTTTSVTNPVTAGTVSDKTGYTLTQSFPTNFASLGINSSGHISRVTLCDTITTYTGDTPQTGDSFARIGATGSGLTSLAPSATALSTAQWTNARAGYLDSLNTGVTLATNQIVVKKNAALANFPFMMVLSSDHVTAATGKSITATRSIDGGSFGSCANSVSEVANGMYKINLAAADLNGTTITLRFTASSCDDTMITILTQP